MKSSIASVLILGLVGMVVGVIAQAQTTATVTATVTPGEVSVTLNRNTVNYGTMLLNSSKVDPQGAITATAGTAEIDLNFTGANATFNIGGTGCGDGVCTWALAAAPGTDAYKHSVTPTGGVETALTTSAQTLVTNLPAGQSKAFTLKIYTPTTGSTETNLGSQYSTTVTVTAVSSL